MPHMLRPPYPIVIFAGPSLCGKSRLMHALAAELPVPVRCVEGDDLHEQANIEKMRHGIALDESDRQTWKQRLIGRITEAEPDCFTLITCSALTRRFREDLRAASDRLCIVLLCLSYETAMARAQHRLRTEPEHYFQPAKHPALLEGQFRDLQRPAPDEPRSMVIDFQAIGQSADASSHQHIMAKVYDFLNLT